MRCWGEPTLAAGGRQKAEGGSRARQLGTQLTAARIRQVHVESSKDSLPRGSFTHRRLSVRGGNIIMPQGVGRKGLEREKVGSELMPPPPNWDLPSWDNECPHQFELLGKDVRLAYLLVCLLACWY